MFRFIAIVLATVSAKNGNTHLRHLMNSKNQPIQSANQWFNKTILSKLNYHGLQSSTELQGSNDGPCGLIYECDLNPLDCGLKIECDLDFSGSDDKNGGSTGGNSGGNSGGNTGGKTRRSAELQGAGNGNCGLIFLCDLGPLDCDEGLKLECDLGDNSDDSETQKSVEMATELAQLQGIGNDGGASLVLECDIGPFICGIKIKWDLGSD